MINEGYKKVIVFCNTKYASESVASQLVDLNFIADSLNGDMSQKDRNRIMEDFRQDKIALLVATDVAARGLDITGVEAVFNYDMPASNEYYTHRIGRTGRAKREGVAYTFATPDDTDRLRNIIRYTRNNILPAVFDDNGKLTVTEQGEQ
ncbi:MAG: C-terminal helicase domain-containing protein [Oscillospiraceae bacterium]|nr:C-terminal helicase domain-containing protein [Oscillospiraceae bacterium]